MKTLRYLLVFEDGAADRGGLLFCLSRVREARKIVHLYHEVHKTLPAAQLPWPEGLPRLRRAFSGVSETAVFSKLAGSELLPHPVFWLKREALFFKRLYAGFLSQEKSRQEAAGVEADALSPEDGKSV
jgi:hypothetical protein